MTWKTRHKPGWLQRDVFGTSDPRLMWPASRLHQEMNRLFGDACRGFDDETQPRKAARRVEVREKRPVARPE